MTGPEDNEDKGENESVPLRYVLLIIILLFFLLPNGCKMIDQLPIWDDMSEEMVDLESTAVTL